VIFFIINLFPGSGIYTTNGFTLIRTPQFGHPVSWLRFPSPDSKNWLQFRQRTESPPFVFRAVMIGTPIGRFTGSKNKTLPKEFTPTIQEEEIETENLRLTLNDEKISSRFQVCKNGLLQGIKTIRLFQEMWWEGRDSK
jgi:hypothetical protein